MVQKADAETFVSLSCNHLSDTTVLLSPHWGATFSQASIPLFKELLLHDTGEVKFRAQRGCGLPVHGLPNSTGTHPSPHLPS